MALEIVWRNPRPVIRTKQTVHWVCGGQSVAVYEVANLDGKQAFLLLCRKAA